MLGNSIAVSLCAVLKIVRFSIQTLNTEHVKHAWCKAPVNIFTKCDSTGYVKSGGTLFCCRYFKVDFKVAI